MKGWKGWPWGIMMGGLGTAGMEDSREEPDRLLPRLDTEMLL